MQTPPPLPIARSAFVNIVGWIFAALSGFGVFITLLQNLMVQLIFVPQFQQQLATHPVPAGTRAPIA